MVPVPCDRVAPVAREISLSIDYRLCQACQPCLASQACRVRAIVRPDPDDSPYLDLERCFDCRLCLPVCPYDAIISLPH